MSNTEVMLRTLIAPVDVEYGRSVSNRDFFYLLFVILGIGCWIVLGLHLWLTQ